MNKYIFTLILFIVIPQITSATGNKYGVFVGISDYQVGDKLPSGVNDAKNICNFFSASCGNGNTALMLDKVATRENILASLKSYQTKAKSGDLFIFYYSGHGTKFPDSLSENQDESSGKDTALVPIDSKVKSGKKWKGLILDDELFNEFSVYTLKGVRVVFISDSCFSGGQTKGGLNLKLGVPKFVNLKSAIGFDEKELADANPVITVSNKSPVNFNGSYIFISSSSENEESYSQNSDTGKLNSLFTYYLLKSLESSKKSNKLFTFDDVEKVVKVNVVKEATENGVHQTPSIISFLHPSNLQDNVF